MESNSQIAIGDFDGDDQKDVVCRMDQGQEYKIALTDGDGFLVNVDFEFGERYIFFGKIQDPEKYKSFVPIVEFDNLLF